MATPDWWKKWRDEAGQYGQLAAPGSGSPSEGGAPVIQPPAQQPQVSQQEMSALSRMVGQPLDYSKMDGAARFFMPLFDGILTGATNYLSGNGGLLGLPTSSSARQSTPDWYKKWRDERGSQGLL